MPLNTQDVKKLKRIIALVQKLIDAIPKAKRGRPRLARSANRNNKTKRLRRTGKELTSFRAMLKAERKKGVPVAELARKYGITPTYIYLLK